MTTYGAAVNPALEWKTSISVLPFKGALFCAKCGKLMKNSHGSYAGHTFRVWSCSDVRRIREPVLLKMLSDEGLQSYSRIEIGDNEVTVYPPGSLPPVGKPRNLRIQRGEYRHEIPSAADSPKFSDYAPLRGFLHCGYCGAPLVPRLQKHPAEKNIWPGNAVENFRGRNALSDASGTPYSSGIWKTSPWEKYAGWMCAIRRSS